MQWRDVFTLTAVLAVVGCDPGDSGTAVDDSPDEVDAAGHATGGTPASTDGGAGAGTADAAGGTAAQPDGSLPATHGTVTLLPEGCDVMAEGVRIVAPPGAVAEPVEVTITVTAGAELADYALYSALYRFEPEGLQFDPPLSVTLPFEGNAELAAIFWSRPPIDGEGQAFERLVSTVDGRNVTAPVAHFSEGFVAQGFTCTVEENDALLRQMVQRPIIPGASIGGVPLLTPDGEPMSAEALLADPQWCDPTLYADGLVWGPAQEIVFLFDQETHLGVQEVALGGYEGTLQGAYSGLGADGLPAMIPVEIGLRARETVDGVELDQFAARGEEAEMPRAWANPRNVTALYRMVRETFFGEAPFPEDYDCVAAERCAVVHLVDRMTRVDLIDSGVLVMYLPDGMVEAISIFPPMP